MKSSHRPGIPILQKPKEIMHPRRKTSEDYHDLAKSLGIRWLGPEVTSIKIKTRWECQNDHRWKATYNSLQRSASNGCRKCANIARRKTASDYHALAKKAGISWIGEEVPSLVKMKTNWMCSQKHTWSTSYVVIRAGHNCPICAGVSKIKIEDYYKLAEIRGYIWLGKEIPQSSLVSTEWECSRGHIWKASFQHIQRGDGCPTCVGTKPKGKEDYLALAQKRGFTWLGPDLPQRTINNTVWQCEFGHRWETNFNAIQRGRGCPFCAGNAKKSIIDYQSLADSRNLILVSNQIPNNVATPAEWECYQGHRWKASYTSIRRGTGCPFCKKLAKKVQKDYLSLANARGFEWLGSALPKNAHEATKWKCSKNHIWSACYSSIQRGTGCPTCSGKIPKNEDDYILLGEKMGFVWAGDSLPKNTHTPTDWICPDDHKFKSRYRNIANGNGCPTCHRLKRRGRSTVRKTSRDYHALAAKRGFEWVGDVEPENTQTKTLWKCIEGHIWKTTYKSFRRASTCPICKGTLRKTELDYKLLAEKMGIIWLSPEIPKNVSTHTEWMCSRGHHWMARYATIARGSGCPFCVGTAPKSEFDYYVLAELRGFEWLDEELPKNIATKTIWVCEKHHVWKATYNSIRSGYGCPQCATNFPKNRQDYIDFAKSKRLKWVGDKLPENTRTKTTWECERQHRFDARYNDLLAGKKCPMCWMIDRPNRASKVLIRELKSDSKSKRQ